MMLMPAASMLLTPAFKVLYVNLKANTLEVLKAHEMRTTRLQSLGQ